MIRKIYPGLACRLEFIVEDSDGLPIASLTHADVSSAGYRNLTDGVASSTTSVSLTSSVAYTSSVAAGKFVTIDGSRGHYAIDAPSGAAGSTLDYAEAVVSFTAGHSVTAMRHEIDLTLLTAANIETDTQDIQSRIPAALLSGRMDASVGAMQSNTLTAAAIATDAGAKIADAIWDEARPGHTTAGTFGFYIDAAISSISGGGGGGLTTEQEEQMDRIESQTSKLSGTPVTVNGNVKPGGQIVLKHGDDHTVALGNAVTVPVDDVGGALHTLMAAVGVGNLSVVAIRGVDPASRVSGTVAALSYSSNVLSVTMQFTAAETVKGVVGPAYNYDVIKTDTPTRTYFSGRLTLTRDAR